MVVVLLFVNIVCLCGCCTSPCEHCVSLWLLCFSSWTLCVSVVVVPLFVNILCLFVLVFIMTFSCAVNVKAQLGDMLWLLPLPVVHSNISRYSLAASERIKGREWKVKMNVKSPLQEKKKKKEKIPLRSGIFISDSVKTLHLETRCVPWKSKNLISSRVEASPQGIIKPSMCCYVNLLYNKCTCWKNINYTSVMR